VPTGAWLGALTGEASRSIAAKHEPKSIVSRRWSQAVLNGAIPKKPPAEVHVS
jgi:hypothetical protein